MSSLLFISRFLSTPRVCEFSRFLSTFLLFPYVCVSLILNSRVDYAYTHREKGLRVQSFHKQHSSAYWSWDEFREERWAQPKGRIGNSVKKSLWSDGCGKFTGFPYSLTSPRKTFASHSPAQRSPENPPGKKLWMKVLRQGTEEKDRRDEPWNDFSSRTELRRLPSF